MRRLIVPSLVAFAALLVLAQAADSSPAVRTWLTDTFARLAGQPGSVAPTAASRSAKSMPATAVAAFPPRAPASPAPAPAGTELAPAVAGPGAAPSLDGASAEGENLPGAAAAGAAVVAFDPAPEESAAPARESAPAIAPPPPVPPPDRTPPRPPSGVAVEVAGDQAVRVHWSAATDDTGVTGYEVLREGRVVATGSELAAAEDGLAPLSKVCYAVTARDAAGNHSAPSAAACATLPDTTPPLAPTVLQARAASETGVALTWSGATDAGGIASYDVVRGGAVVATAGSPRSSDAGLHAGRTYCWTVRARDVAGNVSRDSPQACATLPDLTPPSPPPSVVAAPNAPDRVVFAWNPAQDNVGVDRYEVLRDGRLVARTDAATPFGLEAGLDASSDYCFTVVAVDAAGNRSAAAGPACARTTEPGVPAGPTALAIAPRSPTLALLRWQPSPDPGVVYAVYWGDGRKRIGATPRTEYTVAGLKVGERRCFRVAAVDPAGQESPASLEACTSTMPPVQSASATEPR